LKKKLTYKQRLLYILIGAFVFSFVIYNVALSGTIDMAIKNSDFREQIAKNKNAPEQIKIVKKRIKQIEALVGTNKDYVNVDIHQALLESVTNYVQKNGLVLQDFPQPYEASNNGYITKTAQLTVEGGFINLLQLIYFLETNYIAGKVDAVDFKIDKELRTRYRKLNTKIYIQNVKTETHEKNT
jgi:hypothetical protein